MLEYQNAHILLPHNDLKVAITQVFANGSFHQQSVVSPDATKFLSVT